MGYNARRASLVIVEHFMRRMAVYDLRIVDFSVLSLIAHNPGITSRQLCSTLGVLPPNLVAIISALEKRQLVERHPHPSDRRANGLHLSADRTPHSDRAQDTHAPAAKNLPLIPAAGGGNFMHKISFKRPLILRKQLFIQ